MSVTVSGSDWLCWWCEGCGEISSRRLVSSCGMRSGHLTGTAPGTALVPVRPVCSFHFLEFKRAKVALLCLSHCPLRYLRSECAGWSGCLDRCWCQSLCLLSHASTHMPWVSMICLVALWWVRLVSPVFQGTMEEIMVVCRRWTSVLLVAQSGYLLHLYERMQVTARSSSLILRDSGMLTFLPVLAQKAVQALRDPSFQQVLVEPSESRMYPRQSIESSAVHGVGGSKGWQPFGRRICLDDGLNVSSQISARYFSRWSKKAIPS